MKSRNRQCTSYVSPVSRRGGTKQGTETGSWVEASIWTEDMLAALENGVKGGKSRSDLEWVFVTRITNAGRTPTSLGMGFSP